MAHRGLEGRVPQTGREVCRKAEIEGYRRLNGKAAVYREGMVPQAGREGSLIKTGREGSVDLEGSCIKIGRVGCRQTER